MQFYATDYVPRRPPTPESPRPFVEEPQSTVLFPQVEEPTQLYRKDRLIEYLQEFNNSNSSKVQIWQKHRGLEQSNEHPTVLRFTIPDVFTAYIHLEYAPSRLGVESVTAFGPREKVRVEEAHRVILKPDDTSRP